jgi:hypothetical protein
LGIPTSGESIRGNTDADVKERSAILGAGDVESMGMSEEGRKRLFEAAKKVREKVSQTGDAVLHKKGLLLVEMLARDLSSPESFPGLKLWRDAPSKFRLTRSTRNAEIAVEWQKDVLAAAITCEKHGEPKKMTRYIYEQDKDRWRRMEGEGEIYDDLTSWLVEYLYPEGSS